MTHKTVAKLVSRDLCDDSPSRLTGRNCATSLSGNDGAGESLKAAFATTSLTNHFRRHLCGELL